MPTLVVSGHRLRLVKILSWQRMGKERMGKADHVCNVCCVCFIYYIVQFIFITVRRTVRKVFFLRVGEIPHFGVK